MAWKWTRSPRLPGAIGLSLLVLSIPVASTGGRQAASSMQVDVVVDSSRIAELTARYPGGIPIWTLTRDAAEKSPDSPSSMLASPVSLPTPCPAIIELDLINERLAIHFDSVRSVWEVYCRDSQNDRINRYDIDSNLVVSETPILIDSASPWTVTDLDLDGHLEIVSQWSDQLQIHSAPDWAERARFAWPGYNVYMHPVAVNIDGDSYLELYVTPNTFTSSRAVIVKYQQSIDSFVVIADIVAPFGAAGHAAIADFDQDGRIEFISGYNDFGYSLFEWQDTSLVFVGLLGDNSLANRFYATTCRPKLDGNVYALLGHSPAGAERGYRYELMKPIGDNQFELSHLFEDLTGWSGNHPSAAADVDCDGLDEIVMTFFPAYRAWEWNLISQSFEVQCEWDVGEIASVIEFFPLDLDQNKAAEFGMVNDQLELKALPGHDCQGCDDSGVCLTPDSSCFCLCHGDPICGGTTDVFDVVSAVDVAFRGSLPLSDPYSQCPIARSDVNCDSVTNVFDVVRFVDVAFRSIAPSTAFCDPCLP